MIYRSVASEYAKHRSAHSGVADSLVEYVADREGMPVLEIGCGTGNHSGALLRQTRCACVGVDPSLSMLSEARRLYSSFLVASAIGEALPFGKAHFRLVFSVDVVHHVRNRRKVFAEIARVLEPQGTVCTVTETPDLIRGRSVLSAFFPETVNADLARYPAFETMNVELRDAGLEIYRTQVVEQSYVVSNVEPFEARVFSCLRLISDAAFERGLTALRLALATGPLTGVSRYLAIWARPFIRSAG